MLGMLSVDFQNFILSFEFTKLMNLELYCIVEQWEMTSYKFFSLRITETARHYWR